MKVLRTPEERFAGLPDFGYQPRYAEVDADGLRLAYVEAGPPDGEPVLLLHGEPSWSFLYRKVIPVLAAWQRLTAWDKPFLVAFSDRDPITGGMAPAFKRAVPGAAGRDHPVLTGAGHFLQEDAGEELGAVIASFMRST
jgi:pimeloyl-ACP methyl ester carboxylesterase